MHLSRLFQRSVSMYPERPALAEGAGVPRTYAELDRRVRSIARSLREDLGLQPGDRVTLAMQNCAAYAEAMLAIWHARLCAVPINSKLHPSEIRYVLEDSGSQVCLSRGDIFRALADSEAGRQARLVDVAGPEWQAVLDGPAAHAEAAVGGDEELAWLFYTSGTTGKPKGVMLSHANLVAMALNFHADMLPIDSRDVLLHVAPMSHGSGLYGIPYWMHGGLQVIPASGGLDEAELFELLRHHEHASLFASPTIIMRMVRHEQSDTAELPGLRRIFAGGAPFYVADIKTAVACLGPRIAQMYGQGETPMTISAMRAEAIAQAVACDDDEYLASVGHAQTSIDIEVLDEEGLPCPAGAVGEVTVRGLTVMQGYWKNPGATAKTLISGALRTGDVGLVDRRGLLHLKDRSKDVIISGGTNIYPREVEEALLHHPAVREVSVIGTPHPEWGEVITAVVAADCVVATEELDAVCLERIARFKRPKHYVFVASLPKNATGKVLKTDLRALCAREQ